MQEQPTPQTPEQSATPPPVPQQPVSVQPMAPAESPKKKKHGVIFWVVLSVAILVVLVIIAPIIALVGFGLLLGSGCSGRMEKLNDQQVVISQMLNEVEGISAQEARVNGDCLTGSGTSVRFSSTQPYDSSILAREDIFGKLEAEGLPVPDNIEDTTYVFANDGAYSSGGDTPIAEIEIVYYGEDAGGENTTGALKYDSYRVKLKTLQQYSCEVIDQEMVMCNGMEKEAFIKQILETQPVTSLQVEAQIRAPK